jgi:hypothetical protein
MISSFKDCSNYYKILKMGNKLNYPIINKLIFANLFKNGFYKKDKSSFGK